MIRYFQPLGAADYLSLALKFHTVILSGIPELKSRQLASLKRFTHLIDILYDRHVRMLFGADLPVDRLMSVHPDQSESAAINRQLVDDLGLKLVSPNQYKCSMQKCDNPTVKEGIMMERMWSTERQWPYVQSTTLHNMTRLFLLEMFIVS